jgi:hypothetical protein
MSSTASCGLAVSGSLATWTCGACLGHLLTQTLVANTSLFSVKQTRMSVCRFLILLTSFCPQPEGALIILYNLHMQFFRQVGAGGKSGILLILQLRERAFRSVPSDGLHGCFLQWTGVGGPL